MKLTSRGILEQLPILPTQTLSRESSSYHRSGINRDSGNFLYYEGEEAVLLDAAGPGQVNSIFATNILKDIILRLYFDGQEKPRYCMPVRDFFSGNHPDFPVPMASCKVLGYYLGHDSVAGNLLLPIPFDRSLKITATGDHDFFYHVLWEQYPQDTQILTFPNHFDKEEVSRLWNPQNLPTDFDFCPSESFLLQPNEKRVICEHMGAGLATSLDFELPADRSLLRNLYLCICWDNHVYDSIHAPLDHFFAIPAGPVSMSTPLVSVRLLEDDRIRLSSRWPMPFWQHASFSIVNKGASACSSIKAAISISDNPYPENESGYLTTHYHAGETEYATDWCFLQCKGWGKLTGVVQTMVGDHYCEGDEHFTLDGACTPQINGTGSEDFYLFCFWPNPQICLPYNGSTTDIFKQAAGDNRILYRNPSAYYRFFLDGPITFYRELDARIQHGAMSDIHSQYTSLAFCYLKSQPCMLFSDLILPTNRLSAQMHRYQADKTSATTLTASFIGNGIDQTERLEGYEHEGGEIRFSIAIHDMNNGVLLRRRIDQHHGRQKAAVYVDDVYAGIWLDADENKVHRWKDSDFLIPPDLCRSRNEIDIRLVIETFGEIHFTDYRYEVFSFVAKLEQVSKDIFRGGNLV